VKIRIALEMLVFSVNQVFVLERDWKHSRYDTRCCFNVRSKADISQLNLPHGGLIGCASSAVGLRNLKNNTNSY